MDTEFLAQSVMAPLIERFENAHDTLLLLSYGLNEETARYKIHNDMPSIFDILWHMTAVKHAYSEIAQGKQQTPYSSMQRPKTLEKLLAWFDSTHAGARDILLSLDDSWAGSEDPAPNHSWATKGFVIDTLCYHDTYHLGQISMLAWAVPQKRWVGWQNDDGAPYLYQFPDVITEAVIMKKA